MIGTRNACDIRDVIISQYLRLSFVQPQIPDFIEVVQLLDGLLYLCLRGRQDEHIISEGQ